METLIEIVEKTVIPHSFPALFINKDKTIVILADEKTSDNTFSGMVIHITGDKGKRTVLGKYSTSWTYAQFSRMKDGSEVIIKIIQNDKL